MSTPPPLPDDTLEPSPKPPGRNILQKVTIALSVIVGVTFGLCTVSTMTTRTVNNYLITTALVMEVICILGLIVIAAIVIFRTLRGDY